MAVSELVQELVEKARAYASAHSLERSPHTEDFFQRRLYLSPEDIEVTNYLRRRPMAAFNPGAVLRDGVVHLFPRLVFEYYSYASAIGYAAVPVDELLQGRLPRPLPVQIVLYPTEAWEASRGCEDARAHAIGEGFALFYTGVGKLGEAALTDHKDVFFPALALAELGRDLRLRRKGIVRLGREGEGLLLPTKNATFLEGDAFLLRPSLPGLPDTGWRGRLDREGLRAFALEPVLPPEPFEFKVGWSTNAVRLEDGTYLVAYHGILRADFSYRHGFVRLSGSGELLAYTSYLLAPRGLNESYGDRPLTLYGNGLFLHGEELVFVAGVGDYGIGVMTAPLEEVLKRMQSV